MSNHINEILFALTDAQVEFIVGGGVISPLRGKDLFDIKELEKLQIRREKSQD